MAKDAVVDAAWADVSRINSSIAIHRVHHPNRFHAEIEILHDLVRQLFCAFVGRKNFNRNHRRMGDIAGFRRFAQQADVGNAKDTGRDSDTLFDYDNHAPFAFVGKDDRPECSLQTSVRKLRLGAIDNPPEDVFGIMLERHVVVLFHADQGCRLHGQACTYSTLAEAAALAGQRASPDSDQTCRTQ